MTALERSEAAVAWDLRAAWAAGWEVSLGVARRRRPVRCRVLTVASSGAFAIVWTADGELHVPLARVRSVRRPHFHEGGEPVAAPAHRQALPLPPAGQLPLFAADLDRPGRWVEPQTGAKVRKLRKKSARRP